MMHTPEDILQINVSTRRYSTPVNFLSNGVNVFSVPTHCEDYSNRSVLDIQNEFRQMQINKSTSEPAMVALEMPMPLAFNDSSPDTPQPVYDTKTGWGFFGCLRPILSIIGKAGVNEIKCNDDDWEIPFENIRDLNFLGCGGQGTVYSGKLNNETVAVKKVNSLEETDIKDLRKLNHPNIVKFKGVCTREPSCYSIIMEFCPYGPLYELLQKQKNIITASRIAYWSKQIASGMQYLHAHKIIHRDLKSPNVLIGDNEIIKISDFGTRRAWSGISEKMSFAGTVSWMAPEVIRGVACSEKVDIWAFGVVLWELITCEKPFNDMEPNAIMYGVGCGKLTPPIPSTCPDGYKLIMQMCWKMVPRQRPSFKLISTHLEIASIEILSNSKFEGDKLIKTQESWKEEIKTQIYQFKENMHQYRIEIQLKEECALKKRELELKHIRDIGKLYERKLEKVQQLYMELNTALQQVGQIRKDGSRKREIHCKRKMFSKVIKTMDKKKSGNYSTTPTSPEHSITSPDSPKVEPQKAPMYVQIDPSSKNAEVITQTSTIQTSVKPYRKHIRGSSCSPRSSTFSRNSSTRKSVYVNAETQTDSMEVSETDLSPTMSNCSTLVLTNSKLPQRVILQQDILGSDAEVNNGNSVQLHYFPQTSREASAYNCVVSRSTSPTLFLKEDTLNQNLVGSRDSDEENLDVIGQKVFAITNHNIFTDLRLTSDNGNCIESRAEIDSAEDADRNDDSLTDEEGETYINPLRRKSFGRRPVRRGNRFKVTMTSDEGNTSEYSISPSSKSSTLESNPDRIRPSSLKRPNKSSDSDSEEKMSVATQIAFNVNKTKSKAWDA